MPEPTIIYGGGGHAKVVLDALQDMNEEVAAIIDMKFQGSLLGVPRFSDLPDSIKQGNVVIAIGDNSTRKRISESLALAFRNVIHASAIVSRHATMGTGCMVLHRSVVQAGVSVGNHVIINTGAQIDHDCSIGNFVHVAPGAVLCGSVTVGEGTLIGAGSVVKPGVTIGSWATIGSGAVVVKNIPDHAIVAGNPARLLSDLKP